MTLQPADTSGARRIPRYRTAVRRFCRLQRQSYPGVDGTLIGLAHGLVDVDEQHGVDVERDLVPSRPVHSKGRDDNEVANGVKLSPEPATSCLGWAWVAGPEQHATQRTQMA